jgi:hypothetical protein
VVGWAPVQINEGRILAATSLSELHALMVADQSFLLPIGPKDEPNCEWKHPSLVTSCERDIMSTFTQYAIPPDSLLVMLYRASTLVSHQECLVADLRSVTRTGSQLDFNLANRQPPCARDDRQSWALPWLVTIPLKNLPATVLTLKLNSPPDYAGDINWPTTYRTVVDLASPPRTAPSIAVEAIQGEQAIVATEQAVEKSLHRERYSDSWYLNGIGMQRWADTSLGCPSKGVQPVAKQISGYVVIVTVRSWLQGNPDLTYEYHSGDGRLVYCSGP